MQDDQKDQVLLCANESIEVLLSRLRVFVDSFFFKRDILKGLSTTTAGEKTKLIDMVKVSFAKAWDNKHFMQWLRQKKTDLTSKLFICC